MQIFTVASLVLAIGLAAAPQADDPMTINQAVHKVQQKTGGRVLSAERVRGSHGHTYRIKTLMKNGRVRVIEVDPDPRKNLRNLPPEESTEEVTHAHPAG